MPRYFVWRYNMLDTLKTLPDTQWARSALVTAEELRAARDRQRLLEQARRAATACVVEADAEAEQIREVAYRDGYLQGLLQAANDLGRVLLLEDGMAARLRQDATAVLRDVLEELLVGDEWTTLLLRRWVVDLPPMAQGPLQVYLPMRCKASRDALEVGLKQRWEGPLHIEYHAQQRIVFRVGERVLDLDVPAVSERLAPRLALQLRSLRSAPQCLDEAGRAALQGWLADLLDQAEPAQVAP